MWSETIKVKVLYCRMNANAASNDISICILSYRSMYGQVYPIVVLHRFVYSQDAWTALATKKFWKETCCPSLPIRMQMVIGYGKIMTPSTPATPPKSG